MNTDNIKPIRTSVTLHNPGTAYQNLCDIQDKLSEASGKTVSKEATIGKLAEVYLKAEALAAELAKAKQQLADANAELATINQKLADTELALEAANDKLASTESSESIAETVNKAIELALDKLAPKHESKPNNNNQVNGFVEPVKTVTKANRDFTSLSTVELFESTSKGTSNEKIKRAFLATIEWNQNQDNPQHQLAPTNSILRGVCGCNPQKISEWLTVNEHIVQSNTPINLNKAGIFNKGKNISGITSAIKAIMLGEPVPVLETVETEPEPEIVTIPEAMALESESVLLPEIKIESSINVDSGKLALAKAIAKEIQTLIIDSPSMNSMDLGIEISGLAHNVTQQITALAEFNVANPASGTILAYRSDVFKQLESLITDWEPANYESIENLGTFILNRVKQHVYKSLGHHSNAKSLAGKTALETKAQNMKTIAVSKMIKLACDIIHADNLNEDTDWATVVTAIALLTGRRRYEIIAGKFTLAADSGGDYIDFTGTLKTHPKVGEHDKPLEPVKILVLNNSANAVVKAIQWLRNHRELAQFTPSTITPNSLHQGYLEFKKSMAAKVLAKTSKAIIEDNITLVNADDDWFIAGQSTATIHRLREIYSALAIETAKLLDPSLANTHSRLIRKAVLGHATESSGANYDSIFQLADTEKIIGLHPRHGVR